MTVNKVRFFFILAAIVVLGGFVFLAGQKLQSLRSAQDFLERRSLELASLQKEIVTIQEYLAKYQDEQAELQQYLFAEQDVPSFIDGISQHAKETGMVILDMKSSRFEAVRLSPPENGASGGASTSAVNSRGRGQRPQSPEERGITLAAMPITIKGEGRYADFVAFLNLMEGFKQLLTISDLRVNVLKDYPKLSIDFVIKIYSFKNYEDLKGL